ncbi:hypothetical protein [Pseudomonas aeruginosa]|uniref:hypothetical protein n=2 Tax=Pseudomonas aeruginosa TaxID=287 RepID=UPI0014826C4C|nr:hypothetical protein [Pseudomonas aeruginosa]
MSKWWKCREAASADFVELSFRAWARLRGRMNEFRIGICKVACPPPPESLITGPAGRAALAGYVQNALVQQMENRLLADQLSAGELASARSNARRTIAPVVERRRPRSGRTAPSSKQA